MYYALGFALSLTFFHLTFGAVYASDVMMAYEALTSRNQDVMFLLSMFSVVSGKAFIIIQEKRYLPVHMWGSWKSNIGFIYIYLCCVAFVSAWLWVGFQTGFFQHLLNAWVFVTLVTTCLVILLVQMMYWCLMFSKNRKS